MESWQPPPLVLSRAERSANRLSTECEVEIERIVNEARERVGEYERDKEAALMVYAGACRRLGIDNEFEQDDDED